MIHIFGNNKTPSWDDGVDTISRVLVRTDIPEGCQGAQICHASREVGAAFGSPSKNRARVALLECSSETALLAAAKRLEMEGASFVLIEETEYPKGFTALATIPEPLGGPSKRPLGKFGLWRQTTPSGIST